MTDNLDHKTFDLASALAGIEHPKLVVPVFFNAGVGMAVATLNEGIRVAETLGEESQVKKLHKELDKLLKEVKSSVYKVHLQGVPESVRSNILEKTMEEYPAKTDVFGREEANFARERAFTKALWEAHIVEIEDPEGAKSFLTPETLEALIERAPENVIRGVNEGIEKLSKNTKDGFDFASSEVSFL